MGVGVQSETSTEAAPHTGQRLHIHTVGNRHRGKGMTEVMEPHAVKKPCNPIPETLPFPHGAAITLSAILFR